MNFRKLRKKYLTEHGGQGILDTPETEASARRLFLLAKRCKTRGEAARALEAASQQEVVAYGLDPITLLILQAFLSWLIKAILDSWFGNE